jgi:hypothetical protein
MQLWHESETSTKNVNNILPISWWLKWDTQDVAKLCKSRNDFFVDTHHALSVFSYNKHFHMCELCCCMHRHYVKIYFLDFLLSWIHTLFTHVHIKLYEMKRNRRKMTSTLSIWMGVNCLQLPTKHSNLCSILIYLLANIILRLLLSFIAIKNDFSNDAIVCEVKYCHENNISLDLKNYHHYSLIISNFMHNDA